MGQKTLTNKEKQKGRKGNSHKKNIDFGYVYRKGNKLLQRVKNYFKQKFEKMTLKLAG
jgi:hypothetical protein